MNFGAPANQGTPSINPTPLPGSNTPFFAPPAGASSTPAPAGGVGGAATPAAGGFGNPASAAKPGFGNPTPAAGFGAAGAAKPAGFGNAAAAGGFGTPAAAGAAKPGFGNPAPAAGFGTAGAAKPAGFGNTAAPAASAGGFGAANPATATSGFGNAAAPAAGASGASGFGPTGFGAPLGGFGAAKPQQTQQGGLQTAGFGANNAQQQGIGQQQGLGQQQGTGQQLQQQAPKQVLREDTQFKDIEANTKKEWLSLALHIEEQTNDSKTLSVQLLQTTEKTQSLTKRLKSLDDKLASLQFELEANRKSIDVLDNETKKQNKNAELCERVNQELQRHSFDNYGFQNTSTTVFWKELVTSFEERIAMFASHLEEVDNALNSLNENSNLTRETLSYIMRNNHDAFLALAARVASIHEIIAQIKQIFKKTFNIDPFAELKKKEEDRKRAKSTGRTNDMISILGRKEDINTLKQNPGLPQQQQQQQQTNGNPILPFGPGNLAQPQQQQQQQQTSGGFGSFSGNRIGAGLGQTTPQQSGFGGMNAGGGLGGGLGSRVTGVAGFGTPQNAGLGVPNTGLGLGQPAAAGGFGMTPQPKSNAAPIFGQANLGGFGK